MADEKIKVEFELGARKLDFDKKIASDIEAYAQKNSLKLGIKLDTKQAKLAIKNLSLELKGEAEKAVQVVKGTIEKGMYRYDVTHKGPGSTEAQGAWAIEGKKNEVTIKATVSNKNLTKSMNELTQAHKTMNQEATSLEKTQLNMIEVEKKLKSARSEYTKFVNASKGVGSSSEDKKMLAEYNKQISLIEEKKNSTLSSITTKKTSEIQSGLEQLKRIQSEISKIDANKEMYGGKGDAEHYKDLISKAEKYKQEILATATAIDKLNKSKKNGMTNAVKEDITKIENVQADIAKETKARKEAESALGQYNKKLEERNRLEMEELNTRSKLNAIDAKKPELNAHLNSLKKEKELNDSSIKVLEKKISGTHKESEAKDILAKRNAELNSAQAKFNAQGKAQVGFLDDIANGFKQAAARVINYTVVYRSLWSAIQMGQQALQTIRELDKSMTNIGMVTGGTYLENQKLMSSYNGLAIELKATTAEVAASADTFLRQGKSIQQTNELIKASTVMSKIALMSNAEASDTLTSVLNGYKMSAEEAMYVVDAMSKVDLNAATSVQELSDALQLSASVAETSGVSFEKMLGYIATISEVTRTSASTIGQALKSIFSRMGNVKVGKFVDSESGEALNDVEKTLDKVGIKLRNSETDWRDFGDVLDEVASKWQSFNETEKNALATALGGTRQRNQLLVLFENYGRALELEKDALNSTGSAMEKYGVYADSIEAKQAALNAEFEKAVFNDFTDSAYKILALDLPTYFLKILNSTGLLNAGLMITSGLLVKQAATMAKDKLIEIALMKKLTAVNITQNTILEEGVAAKAAQLIVDEGYNKVKARQIIITLGASEAEAANAVATVASTTATTGATAATVGYTAAQKAASIATMGLKKAMDFLSAHPLIAAILAVSVAIQTTTWLIDMLTVSLEEQKTIVDELSGKVSELSSEYDQLKQKSDKTEEEEHYLKLLEYELELQKEALKLEKQNLANKQFAGSGAGLNYTQNVRGLTYTDEAGDRTQVDKDLVKLTDLYKQLGEAKDVASRKSIFEDIQKEEAAYYDVAKAIKTSIDSGVTLNDAWMEFYNNWRKFDDERIRSVETIRQETQAMYDFQSVIGGVKDGLKSVADAYQEMDEYGEISIDTVLDIIENKQELIDALYVEGDAYKLNLDKVAEYYDEKLNLALNDINTEKNRIQAQIDAANIEMQVLQKRLAAFQNFGFGINTVAIVTNAQIANLKNVTDGLSKQMDNLNKASEITANMGLSNMNKKMKSLSDNSKSASDAVKELAQKEMDLMNAIGKAAIYVLDKQMDKLKELKEEQEKVFDERKAQLEEELKLLEEKYDAEDRELELKKAQEAYEQALKQQNVRIYSQGKGWYWGSDPQAVQDAKDKLDELNKKYQREDEKKVIKDKIEALEAEKKAMQENVESQLKDLQKLKDGYNDAMNNIYNELMNFPEALDYIQKFESASYNERLRMLSDFVTRYNAAYAQLNTANQNVNTGSVGGGGGGGGARTVYIWDSVEYASEAAAQKAKENELKQIQARLNAAKDSLTKSYIKMEYDAKKSRNISVETRRYAKGGVGFFGEEGLIDYTGMQKNGKNNFVDGSQGRPELIIPESKAAKLWGFIQKLPAYTPTSTVNNNGNSGIVIDKMYVSVPNNQTFDAFVGSIKQRAKTSS